MIGYLFFSHDKIQQEKVETIISRMLTFKLLKKITVQNICVCLIQNKYPNNYLLENEQHTLVATGTLIYQSQRGNSALKLIMQKLDSGVDIQDIYLQFNGPYNLLHIDYTKNECFLFTDRECLQSAYFYTGARGNIISSSQFLLAALVEPGINEDAVKDFVHLGSVMDWQTIFKGINKLPGALQLRIAGDNCEQKKLWQIQVQSPYLPDTDKQIIDKTYKMFCNDMEVVNSIPDDRLLVDLTGGTDTRTILSFVLQNKKNFVTSTAGPEDHIDVVISKKISREMNLSHYWAPDKDVEVTEENLMQAIEMADGARSPFPILKALPYFEEKTKRFDMVVGGNGGPLFKDHYWLFELNQINKNREPNWGRIAKYSIAEHTFYNTVFQDGTLDFYSVLSSRFKEFSQKIKGTNNQKLDFVYFCYKCPSFHAPQFSFANQFMDVLHPMMNADLVEYMLNIKPNIRKSNILQFSMIYKNSRKLAWLKTDNGCPAVPPTGKFKYLYSYRFLRYFKAFSRKISALLFKNSAGKPIHSVASIIKVLDKLGVLNKIKQQQLKTKSIYNAQELTRIINNQDKSQSSVYFLNILAIELFLEKVEHLSNGRVHAQS